ncbi:transcription factor A, mitochondrial-like isoform X2 [Babylonia areolata]|uniref:transcription factor A, mitochondrial-like isoform X2 n=1 Tax=Babylonia areolata TaxID=304850 RepID=UPI003FD3780A
MAFAFKTALALRVSSKVFVDTSRSRPHIFLTALGAHNQQCCQISNSQPFWKSLQPPKRPPGAFLKFMNQRSQEITAKFPDASHVERCKIAGQLWRNLDSDEKNTLKLGAREELQDYHKKYQTFLEQLNCQETVQFLQGKKDKRKKKAFSKRKKEFQRLGRPKKPPNCFSLYIKETRAQQGRADPPGFLQGLVQSWKLMSENEKEIYRTKANREKGKYEQEMTRWEQKMKHMGREDLIRKKSVNKPASSTKTTGKKTGR